MRIVGLLLLFFTTTAFCLDPYVVINKQAPEINAIRGSTFEIGCVAINRVAIQVRWEKETPCGDKMCRTQLSLDRLPDDQQKYGLKFIAQDTYILIIKNVDVTDEGYYYCQLQLTRYVKVYDRVKINVVEAPLIDPMTTSSDQLVSTDSDVDLNCQALGKPKPRIRWTRAGNGKMPGGGFFSAGEKLTIKKITPEFRGPYICTATNNIGEAHRIINIDMRYPPNVTANPMEVSQKVGYGVRLVCHVDANPAPEVSWFRGSTLIDSDSEHKVTTYQAAFKKVISKLTISSVSSDDYSTEYKCIATNNPGTGSISTPVSFKIIEVSEPQKVYGLGSGNVLKISWTVLALAVTAIILSY